MTPRIAWGSPVIKVEGIELSAAQYQAMSSMRVERELCNVGRTVLRFLDPGYVVATSSTFALGKSLKVTGGEDASSIGTFFDGVVTAIGFEKRKLHRGQGFVSELVVTADDRGVLFGLGNKVVAYKNVTDSSVLSQMVGDYHLSAEVTSTSTQHEYLMQNGSDRALLDTLTARNALVWWVDGKTLKVKRPSDATSGPPLSFSDDLIEFSVRGSGLRPTAVKVTGWDSKKAAELTSSNASADGTFASGQFAGLFADGKVSDLTSKTKRVEGFHAPEDSSDADVLAKGLLTQWQANSVVARGRTRARSDIDLLIKVDVKDAGPTTGTYLVTRLEHHWTVDGFYTTFTAGPIRPTGLVDAPVVRHSDPLRMSGLYAATVSENSDPDGLGRVKVKYPAVGDDVESNWARVVSIGGGKNRGITFHPEVGDEVLVGFERGDSRHPVVLGGLYSDNAAFPTAKDALLKANETNIRAITSRSGHVITLCDDDSPSESAITITHKNGDLIKMSGESTELTISNRPLSFKNGQASIEFSDSGNITIKGVQISIQAQASMELKAAQFKAESQGPLDMQGAMVSVKGQAEMQLDGGGMTTIKGGMVQIN